MSLLLLIKSLKIGNQNRNYKLQIISVSNNYITLFVIYCNSNILRHIFKLNSYWFLYRDGTEAFLCNSWRYHQRPRLWLALPMYLFKNLQNISGGSYFANAISRNQHFDIILGTSSAHDRQTNKLVNVGNGIWHLSKSHNYKFKKMIHRGIAPKIACASLHCEVGRRMHWLL